MPASPESEAEFRAAVEKYLETMLAEGFSLDDATSSAFEILKLTHKDKGASFKVVSKPEDDK